MGFDFARSHHFGVGTDPLWRIRPPAPGLAGDSFADEQRLARTLSRERFKDSSLDDAMPAMLEAASPPSRAPQRADWRRALAVDRPRDMADQRPDYGRQRGLEREPRAAPKREVR